MFELWASTNRAQPTVLVSMTGVDGAGSSAAGGDAEVAQLLFVELVLAARLEPNVTFLHVLR